MMSSQFARTLLSGSSLSADQQDAAPDSGGSYGDLMDVIDRILEPVPAEVEEPNPDGGHPSAGLAFAPAQE
jgi:hypothetical protein